jgi:uncharacterized protein (TIGR02270 family)
MKEVLALLDHALLGLRGVTDAKIKIRDAEREIAAALFHTYRALASSGDAGAFDQETASALGRARDALKTLQEVETADRATATEMSVIAHAVRLLAENPAPPDPAPLLPRQGRAIAVLLATKGEPQLLDLDRSVLYPTVPLSPSPEAEPEEPTASAPPVDAPALATDEDIAALLAAGEAAIGALNEADDDEKDEKKETEAGAPAKNEPLGPPDEALLERQYLGLQVDEQDVVVERARASFEDLSAFGMMRVPQPDETWLSAERVEQRLFARIDAIVACGPWVFPRLVKMLEELPVPDPDMTWATVMLFGSLVGDDSLDQALRVAKASELEVPDMVARIADAFAVAPHPGIEAAMRPWLRDEEPGRRAVAVAVLGRRGVLVADDAVMATTDPDARVVLAGAEALATAIGDVPAAAIEPLLRHDEPTVVRAAIASATARRTRQGVARATELTGAARGDFADAAVFTAIGGDVDVRGALNEDQAASGSDVLIEALGWFGDLGFVDYLLGRMSTGEPTTKVACVAALQMLTGASLTKAHPKPDYPDDALPFTVEGVMPEDVGPLLVDEKPWAEWWEKHRRNARAKTRYRFGHPWSPRDNLWQMESPSSGTRTRTFAHLELVARMSATLPFDVRDFVVRQRRTLESWRELVEGYHGRAPAGSWNTSWQRP